MGSLLSWQSIAPLWTPPVLSNPSGLITYAPATFNLYLMVPNSATTTNAHLNVGTQTQFESMIF